MEQKTITLRAWRVEFTRNMCDDAEYLLDSTPAGVDAEKNMLINLHDLIVRQVKAEWIEAMHTTDTISNLALTLGVRFNPHGTYTLQAYVWAPCETREEFVDFVQAYYDTGGMAGEFKIVDD